MTIPKGRIGRRPTILETRPLTREDLAGLGDQPRPQFKLKTIRESHHRVARLIAAGLRPEEVVAMSGFSYQRIYTLSKDPAFAELVASYGNIVTEKWLQAYDAYAAIAISNKMKAEAQIADHLEEAEETGDKIPLKSLLAITSDRADRFGYGKKSMTVNANIDMGSRLEQAILRSGKAQVLDATPVPVSHPLPAPAPVSRPATVSQPVPSQASLGASLRTRVLRRA